MGRDPITLMNRYMATTLLADVGSEGFDLTRANLAQLNGIFEKGKVKSPHFKQLLLPWFLELSMPCAFFSRYNSAADKFLRSPAVSELALLLQLVNKLEKKVWETD